MTNDTIPSYWLTRPTFRITNELETTFEAIFKEQIAPAKAHYIENLPVPTWVFLCWLTDEKDILLHGSGNTSISLFEPRSPNDESPDDFSKQKAVFAAGDGIWPIFYAIMDRENYRFRMLNSTLQFEISPDNYSDMRYFFSITEGVLSQKPWRNGDIYVLPKRNFAQQPPYELADRRVFEPHFANPKPVKAIAKLSVCPSDFPFLDAIREHSEATIKARAAQDPYGFPWLD